HRGRVSDRAERLVFRLFPLPQRRIGAVAGRRHGLRRPGLVGVGLMTATYRRNADAQAYFDSLTPEGILATLHASREARKAEGRRIIDKGEPSDPRRAQPDFKHGSQRDDYNAMHLREGVAL